MSNPRVKRTKVRRWMLNAMFIVSLLIIITYVSFSWFNNARNAEVSGITMNVAKGTEMVIRTDQFPEGTKSLDINFDRDHPLLSLAGNGRYFYTAEVGFPDVEYDGAEGDVVIEKEVLGYASAGELTDVEDYLEIGAFAMDFSLYIEKDTEVYLYGAAEGGESFVIPAPAEHYEDGMNKSPYGDFDVGRICGAIRIAFLQKDAEGVYQPTLLWAPDTSTHLKIDEAGQYSVSEASEEYEETYIYLSENTTKIEIDTEGTGQGSDSTTTDGVIYAWGELPEKQRIGTLTSGVENEFRLVVWVDGHDRECDNALLSGLISVGLKIGT